MIKIIHIEIHRFRSLMDLDLDFDDDYNLVTICGKNNVGKTNVLRAVNLFLIKMITNLRLICLYLKVQQVVHLYILRLQCVF